MKYLAYFYNPMFDNHLKTPVVVEADSLEDAICDATHLNVVWVNLCVEVVTEDEAHDKNYNVEEYKETYVFEEDIMPKVGIKGE